MLASLPFDPGARRSALWLLSDGTFDAARGLVLCDDGAWRPALKPRVPAERLAE